LWKCSVNTGFSQPPIVFLYMIKIKAYNNN
jgi:hypothetical protein